MMVLDAVGRGFAQGWWMFFDTMWALVLGFALSGAVQAFVSRAEMQCSLGDHRPRTLTKSSFFGVISSSCSYAASALAKTLFARGADFTAAMVFMVASTNLVIELGIVLWLLLGWQFALAEFVGGAIMIVLLGLVVPRVIPSGWIDDARERLNRDSGHVDAHDHHGEQDAVSAVLPWRQRIRSRAGWSEASGFTISDLTMIRKEIVAGFAIAGFAAALVPTWLWRSIFLTGHGFWSNLENAVLGPFLAIISFVCSIGNVPLAAALWKGGISFGGVISFVFADLITLPLLLIYRKYYGTRLTLRLLGVFWAVMSAGGLATQYLFELAHIIPANQLRVSAATHFGANYTTVLNGIALIAFAVICWSYRCGLRGAGDDSRYAKDVMCGMQVEKAHAPATTTHDGRSLYFCSDHCQHRFMTSLETLAAEDGGRLREQSPVREQTGVDPVCGMAVRLHANTIRSSHEGTEYVFCSTGCRERFASDRLRTLT